LKWDYFRISSALENLASSVHTCYLVAIREESRDSCWTAPAASIIDFDTSPGVEHARPAAHIGDVIAGTKNTSFPNRKPPFFYAVFSDGHSIYLNCGEMNT